MSSRPSGASTPSNAASGSRAASLAARAGELPRSAWWLVVANLVPLAGVLLLGWDLGPVMLLFWAENVVIGLFSALRIALVAGGYGLVLVPFFALHYGLFTLVHGVFVATLFGGASAREAATILLPGVLALLASHGASFVMNFLRGGERERLRAAFGSIRVGAILAQARALDTSDPDATARRRAVLDAKALMLAPYRRIVVLHLTIIVGGFLALALGAPAYALAILVLLKTAVDLRAHVQERRRVASTTSGPEATA